jgi:hypothetical protein
MHKNRIINVVMHIDGALGYSTCLSFLSCYVSHFISVYWTSCLVYSKGVVYTSISIATLCLFQGHVRLRRPTRLPQVLQLSSLSVEVSQPIHTPPHLFPRHFSTRVCYRCI